MSKDKLNIRAWIEAARLRTLPLAFSCILTGTAVAMSNSSMSFAPLTFILILLTTLFLQVLSNWANDYGDYVKGTDNETRIGPQRALQSGDIDKDSMRVAIMIMSLCALISGLILLYITEVLWTVTGLVFLTFGLLAIWAAIKYTAGKNPYGYAGFGDMAVFFFFGLLGVLGTAFLFNSMLPFPVDVFPAAGIGFLSAAVLNLNNMRDAEDDSSKGKRSMAVRLGPTTSKVYHACLITFGILCFCIYSTIRYKSPMSFLFILIVPVLLAHLIRVMRIESAKDLDPELKKVAISTFILSVLFLISALI